MLADDSALARRVHGCLDAGHQQLAGSLSRLALAVPGTAAQPLAAELREHLATAPLTLSPWLYLGYYELGQQLLAPTTAPTDAARAPGGGQPVDQASLATALELIRHGLTAAEHPTVVAFGDSSVAPEAHWLALLAMLQEGGDFVSDLSAPAGECLSWFEGSIRDARHLIARVDPELHGLMERLQRLLVLAVPGPRARAAGQDFGGATAFFFRGASVLNASRRHPPTAMVEVLVHEYAHGELFALGQEQVLCHNLDDERHAVLIRSDPRPMHGILHSMHVTGRVVSVLDKILEQPPESLSERGSSVEAFRALRDRVQAYGLSSLAVVQEHARLTPVGLEVVEAAAIRLGQAPGPTLAPRTGLA